MRQIGCIQLNESDMNLMIDLFFFFDLFGMITKQMIQLAERLNHDRTLKLNA